MEFWPRWVRQNQHSLILTNPWVGWPSYGLFLLISVCFLSLAVMGVCRPISQAPTWVWGVFALFGTVGLWLSLEGLGRPRQWRQLDWASGCRREDTHALRRQYQRIPYTTPFSAIKGLQLWIEPGDSDTNDDWCLALLSEQGQQVPLLAGSNERYVRHWARVIQHRVPTWGFEDTTG
jgi:hypothetical protein